MSPSVAESQAALDPACRPIDHSLQQPPGSLQSSQRICIKFGTCLQCKRNLVLVLQIVFHLPFFSLCHVLTSRYSIIFSSNLITCLCQYCNCFDGVLIAAQCTAIFSRSIIVLPRIQVLLGREYTDKILLGGLFFRFQVL